MMKVSNKIDFCLVVKSLLYSEDFMTLKVSQFFHTTDVSRFQGFDSSRFWTGFFDDILLMSSSKPHRLQRFKQIHDIPDKNYLKLTPGKTFLLLFTVKYLGHEIGFNTNKPVQSTTTVIHKNLSPTTQNELMMFIGSMDVHYKFNDRLHVNMKHLYDLLLDQINFCWNKELETLFNQIKMSSTKHVTPTLHDTNHPMFVTVDF